MSSSPKQGSRRTTRHELDSLVVNIELTLSSIIQGVALSVLTESSRGPLGDLRFDEWPYVLNGLLIILLFWSRSVSHTLTLIRWPLEFGHNFLYIACTLVEAITFTDLTDPLRWRVQRRLCCSGLVDFSCRFTPHPATPGGIARAGRTGALRVDPERSAAEHILARAGDDPVSLRRDGNDLSVARTSHPEKRTLRICRRAEHLPGLLSCVCSAIFFGHCAENFEGKSGRNDGIACTLTKRTVLPRQIP